MRIKLETFRILAISSIFLLMTMIGCNEEEVGVSFTEGQLEQLLSTDTLKNWHMLSKSVDGIDITLENCSPSPVLRFERENDTIPNIFYYDVNCAPTFFDFGVWDVVNFSESTFSDSLLFMINGEIINVGTDEETVIFDTVVNIVESITSQQLIISRVEVENEIAHTIEEEYSANPSN